MLDASGLMFIEPVGTTCEPPITDELTTLADRAFAEADPGPPEEWYRGWHTCACGARSDNKPWRTRGVLTNSLIVHYVRDHRSEVPPSELRKLEAWR